MDDETPPDLNPITIEQLFRRQFEELDETDIVLSTFNKQKLRNDISVHLREFLDNGGAIVVLAPTERHGPVRHTNGQIPLNLSANKERREALARARAQLEKSSESDG